MLEEHVPASLPEEPPQAGQVGKRASSAIRVLLIEDNKSFSSAFKRALGQFAVDCVVAETMATARGLIRAWGDSFDAILLDLKLPDGRGEDLLPELEALPRQPGIVIFSDFLLEMRPEVTSCRTIPTSKQVMPPVLASLLHVTGKRYAECTLDRFAKDHNLTRKEHEVLQRIARGDSPKGVALDLGCSLQAVYAHLARIARKTGCSSYHETVAKLFQFSCRGLGQVVDGQ